jgi:hypothetical protein
VYENWDHADVMKEFIVTRSLQSQTSLRAAPRRIETAWKSL